LGAQPEGGAKTISDDDLNVSQVPRGQRNTHLFQELLRTAPHCDDFEALLDVARTRNAFVYEAPLPDAEVVRTASSAWRYECEGRNWVGRAPTTVLDREELHLFAGHKNGGDALLLWSYLEGQHAKRAADIVVDRKAMAAANLLPEWTEWRYRKAIKALRDLQLLRLVAQGGSQNRRFGPHRFRLVRPVERFRPNTMKTSPPASIRKDEGDQTQNIQNCSTITKAGRRR